MQEIEGIEGLDEGDPAGGETMAVTLAQDRVRLDKALTDALPAFSRSRLHQLIVDGWVRQADGRLVDSPNAKFPTGTELILTLPPLEEMTLTPENVPLAIVHEDEDLLVIDKPAGMSVHPAPGSMHGTLVHALLHHCGDSLSGIGGVARPGIVHRIDKDTTGLIVVAKHDAAHRHLSAQLADRSLSRRYAAFVWGVPKQMEGSVNAPIGRHPKDRKQMAVVQGGRESITHYTLRETFGDLASQVECRLESGRTHQIRVHMKHLGHPLIGDQLYGGRPSRQAPEAWLSANGALGRQALHAFEISFRHPRNDKLFRATTPLPDDLHRLMALLRQPA